MRSKSTHAAIEGARRRGGPSLWLHRLAPSYTPSAGPWRTDMHIWSIAITGRARLTAMKGAVGRLGFFAVRSDRKKHRDPSASLPADLQQCIRCRLFPGDDGSQETHQHALLECPGIGGMAMRTRNRRLQRICQVLGKDPLKAKTLKQWLLPLSVGFVHPKVVRFCSKTEGSGCRTLGEHKISMLLRATPRHS